ncbi:MAG: hypothetical protein ABJE47_05700 [bacterium]
MYWTTGVTPSNLSPTILGARHRGVPDDLDDLDDLDVTPHRRIASFLQHRPYVLTSLTGLAGSWMVTRGSTGSLMRFFATCQSIVMDDVD